MIRPDLLGSRGYLSAIMGTTVQRVLVVGGAGVVIACADVREVRRCTCAARRVQGRLRAGQVACAGQLACAAGYVRKSPADRAGRRASGRFRLALPGAFGWRFRRMLQIVSITLIARRSSIARYASAAACTG